MQNLERIKQFLPKYKYLLLDSDCTTDFNEVDKILYENCVISTTFISAENVLFNLFLENSNYDLSNSIVIVDEAHNIINNNNLIKIISSFPKVLLVTATPQICMEEILNCSTIYQYNFSNAIKDKYICDYNIYLPVIELKDNIDIVDIEKPEELLELDDNLSKKGLFLINGMLDVGARKCIVFLNTIEECNYFKDIVISIMENYHYMPYWIEIITSECNYSKRNEILDNFQYEKENERKDIIKILLSIRILNEGVDIIKCDSVFIGKMGDKMNDILTVQRICRANRLDKLNPNKIAHCFFWCDSWNKSLNVMRLMKESDYKFESKIKIIGSNYEKKTEIKNREKIKLNNTKCIEYINVKCVELNETKKCEEKINTNINKLSNTQKSNTKYICKRCNYMTYENKDITKHLSIKKRCCQEISTHKYSQDQLIVLTVLPYISDIHTINENELEHLSNSTYINDNRTNYLKCINEMNKTHSKICKFCNNEYRTLFDLKKHIAVYCFHSYYTQNTQNDDANEINNTTNTNNLTTNGENSKITNVNNNGISHIDNTTNIDNSITINNNNNNNNNNVNNINNNINLNVTQPIGFDEDWNITHMDNRILYGILFDTYRYTSFLEYVLEKDENLNVIMTQDSDCSYVYKNEKEKYIKLKNKDIADITFEKIKNQLLDINDNYYNNTKMMEKSLHEHIRRVINRDHIYYENQKKLGNNTYINEIRNDFNYIYLMRKLETIKLSNEYTDFIEYLKNKSK